MATETHKRAKFSADYRDGFTPESVTQLMEATDCKNRSELMSKLLSALDNEVREQALINELKRKSEGKRTGLGIMTLQSNNGLHIRTCEVAVLTEEERAIVEEAMRIERIDIGELVKRGVLMIARSYVSVEESKKLIGFDGMSFLDLEKLGKERRTIRGLSEAKIEKAFEMIQEFNKDQSDPEKRLTVSQDAIYKITNSNIVTIRNWVENHPTDIEEANHGIEPKRGMKREEIRELLADYMNPRKP